MIPAPRGLVALYSEVEEGHRRHEPADIIAFDDDGRPLVVDLYGKHDKTRLIPADTYPSFAGIGHHPHAPLVALLPAGGWRVEWTDSDGATWSEPLVGWGLRASGDVVPLTTDGEDGVDPLGDVGTEYRVYHPDATGARGPASDA